MGEPFNQISRVRWREHTDAADLHGSKQKKLNIEMLQSSMINNHYSIFNIQFPGATYVL